MSLLRRRGNSLCLSPSFSLRSAHDFLDQFLYASSRRVLPTHVPLRGPLQGGARLWLPARRQCGALSARRCDAPPPRVAVQCPGIYPTIYRGAVNACKKLVSLPVTRYLSRIRACAPANVACVRPAVSRPIRSWVFCRGRLAPWARMHPQRRRRRKRHGPSPCGTCPRTRASS